MRPRPPSRNESPLADPIRATASALPHGKAEGHHDTSSVASHVGSLRAWLYMIAQQRTQFIMDAIANLEPAILTSSGYDNASTEPSVTASFFNLSSHPRWTGPRRSSTCHDERGQRDSKASTWVSSVMRASSSSTGRTLTPCRGWEPSPRRC